MIDPYGSAYDYNFSLRMVIIVVALMATETIVAWFKSFVRPQPQ